MKDIRNILASKTKQALSSNLLNADSIRKNIIILDELKELIPPLMDEEFAQLEKNILEHGCQTPLQSGRGIGLRTYRRTQSPSHLYPTQSSF